MNNTRNLYQTCSNTTDNSSRFGIFNCSNSSSGYGITIEPDIEQLLESKKQFDRKLTSMCKQLKIMVNDLESYMQLNNELFEDNLQHLIEIANNNNVAPVSANNENAEIQRPLTPATPQPSIISNESIDSIDYQTINESDSDQSHGESTQEEEEAESSLDSTSQSTTSSVSSSKSYKLIESLQVDEIDQLPKYQLNQLINFLYETIVNNDENRQTRQSNNMKNNCLEQFERLYNLTTASSQLVQNQQQLASVRIHDTTSSSTISSSISSLDDQDNKSSRRSSSIDDDTLFGFSPIESLCESNNRVTTANYRDGIKSLSNFTFDIDADDGDDNDTGYNDNSASSPIENHRVMSDDIPMILEEEDDNNELTWNKNRMYLNNKSRQQTSQSMINLDQNEYDNGEEENFKDGVEPSKLPKTDLKPMETVRSKSSLSLTRSNTTVGTNNKRNNLKTVQIRHYDELTGQECYEEVTLKPVKRSETIAVSGKDSDRWKKNFNNNNSNTSNNNNDDNESLSFDKRRNLWERRSLERRFKFTG